MRLNTTSRLPKANTQWRNIVDSPGQILFDTPGYHTWRCPDNVTSVSIVCVGAGGNGSYYGSGGGGGALAYGNNIAVTPGQVYTLYVGGINERQREDLTYLETIRDGGNTWFQSTSFLFAGGGYGGRSSGGNTIGSPGGGAGGYSGVGSTACGTGTVAGGAGGVSSGTARSGGGNGGVGGKGTTTTQVNLTGGIQGSGGSGGTGGGVGVWGQGNTGIAIISVSTFSDWWAYTPGQQNNDLQGSWDKAPAELVRQNDFSQSWSDNLMLYGAGGNFVYSAGRGALRIIWPGTTRQFPSTNTQDMYP